MKSNCKIACSYEKKKLNKQITRILAHKKVSKQTVGINPCNSGRKKARKQKRKPDVS